MWCEFPSLAIQASSTYELLPPQTQNASESKESEAITAAERRGRDLNLRYGFTPYADLANRCSDSPTGNRDNELRKPRQRAHRPAHRFEVESDPELARLIEAWPMLPRHIRATIATVLRSALGEDSTVPR